MLFSSSTSPGISVRSQAQTYLKSAVTAGRRASFHDRLPDRTYGVYWRQPGAPDYIHRLLQLKNISEIELHEFDLLVCSGVSATKWWANQNADEDRARIDGLLGHLHSVRARRVFVISTVDVYPVTRDVDESFDCHAQANHAYGVNRLYFEDKMKYLFPEAMICRIGGVFGPGLKKNLIYDLLHDNGVEKINPDSSFQFYNVNHLWADLETMERQGLSLVNFLTEPVTMREVVVRAFPGKPFGSDPAPQAAYDVRTRYAAEMGASGLYLESKEAVLRGLTAFVAQESAGAAQG